MNPSDESPFFNKRFFFLLRLPSSQPRRTSWCLCVRVSSVWNDNQLFGSSPWAADSWTVSVSQCEDDLLIQHSRDAKVAQLGFHPAVTEEDILQQRGRERGNEGLLSHSVRLCVHLCRWGQPAVSFVRIFWADSELCVHSREPCTDNASSLSSLTSWDCYHTCSLI